MLFGFIDRGRVGLDETVSGVYRGLAYGCLIASVQYSLPGHLLVSDEDAGEWSSGKYGLIQIEMKYCLFFALE